MRLVGQFEQEEQALNFSSFLSHQGIENRYEPAAENLCRIWVMDEERFKVAADWYELYRKNPLDPIFTQLPPKIEKINTGDFQKEPPRPTGFKTRILLRPRIPRFRFTLTNFLIAICAFLFLWTTTQQVEVIKKRGVLAAQVGLTPIQETLMFDYPLAMEKLNALLEEYPLKSFDEVKKEPYAVQKKFQDVDAIPMWPGVVPLIIEWKKTGIAYLNQVTLFEKIRTGEFWRLITPVLLHGNFFHILFNMAWLWVLGRQLEERIGKLKLIFLMLVVGIISNISQYMMSGPFFLGYSGIIVGMAGFIWMRQKMAPWEGYPTQKGTFIFLFFFLVAMAGLDVLSFVLQMMQITSPIPNIANTAHIVGGLVGIGLARLPFFARSAA